jgi:steroid 5-alpha reductase family enzyme
LEEETENKGWTKFVEYKTFIMLVTILLLIFTVVILPIITFNFGTPPTDLQVSILWIMSYWLAGVIAYCFLVGEVSRNNSQVDKLWSVVPLFYVWYMTYLGNFTPRMVLMSFLVTVWGIRLTYNFARRGAYIWKFWAGEEDYRWEELRKRKGFNNKFIWALFNLFFISGYQNVLIFLFTVPILADLNSNSSQNLNSMDFLLALLFIGAVVVEFIADQQQYDFQKEKHRRIQLGLPLEAYAYGFVRTGLWGIVRHPNYAMEQLIWVLFYFFSVSATGEWINWSVAGCILLIILFKGSSDFSEEISAKKYPEYKEYQRQVPRFVPFLKGIKKANH